MKGPEKGNLKNVVATQLPGTSSATVKLGALEVSVLQENAASVLRAVAPAVPKKSTLPVLQCIYLEATPEGEIYFSGTNLSLILSAKLGGEVRGAGAVAVDGQAFADYVQALPADRLDLAYNPKTRKLELRCKKHKANLNTMEAADYPTLALDFSPDFPPRSIEAEDLLAAIHQVIYAAAPDDSRPVLQGIRFRFEPEGLELACADGFRLAVKTLKLPASNGASWNAPSKKKKKKKENGEAAPEGASGQTDLIVSAPELARIGTFFSKESGLLRVGLDPARNHLVLRGDTGVLSASLIDGNYPNVYQIIPRSYTSRIVADNDLLLRALKAAGVFAREASNIVRFQTVPGEDPTLRIVSVAAETGDQIGELPAVLEGAPLEIAFNVAYLRETIDSFPTDRSVMELGQASTPGIFKPEGDDSLTCVVMPMHFADHQAPPPPPTPAPTPTGATSIPADVTPPAAPADPTGPVAAELEQRPEAEATRGDVEEEEEDEAGEGDGDVAEED